MKYKKNVCWRLHRLEDALFLADKNVRPAWDGMPALLICFHFINDDDIIRPSHFNAGMCIYSDARRSIGQECLSMDGAFISCDVNRGRKCTLTGYIDVGITIIRQMNIEPSDVCNGLVLRAEG